jgi:hypothetical protein
MQPPNQVTAPDTAGSPKGAPSFKAHEIPEA